MSLKKVIEVARGELGYTEDPAGSNKTKYGKAYGWDGVPWCCTFLWWVFQQADEAMAFFAGAKTASCTTLAKWYKAQGQTEQADFAKIGDIVFLNFRGTQSKDHCGLVVNTSWDVQNHCLESVTTIEGNTSPGMEGSQDNGGCVAMKTRYRKNIVEVARPVYKPEEKQKDFEGHWAEQHIRWAMEAGIMQGYPDGSFRPDQAVTRAELATILHRLEAGR